MELLPMPEYNQNLIYLNTLLMKWQNKNYIVESLTEKYKDSVTDNDAKLSREQAARNQAESIAISRANLKVSQDNLPQQSMKRNSDVRVSETDTVDPVMGKYIQKKQQR
jgi:hypothetical protein